MGGIPYLPLQPAPFPGPCLYVSEQWWLLNYGPIVWESHLLLVPVLPGGYVVLGCLMKAHSMPLAHRTGCTLREPMRQGPACCPWAFCSHIEDGGLWRIRQGLGPKPFGISQDQVTAS